MKIICIGRNYKKHALELGNPIPSEPIFFLKPDTAIQPKGHPFFIPDFSNNIQYETELVIKISKAGKHIEECFAHKYYSEIGLGIDFTARDIQNNCKKNGYPWEIAKSFDGAAQISNVFIQKETLDINNISFYLKRNKILVQKGSSSNMIFTFDQIISYISKFITLKIGDLIYTGTPSGVGYVEKGDVLQGYINEKEMLIINIR